MVCITKLVRSQDLLSNSILIDGKGASRNRGAYTGRPLQKENKKTKKTDYVITSNTHSL